MGWEPAGEESRDAPLRLRRSRLQPSFGQISPLKRPFGALLGQIGNGDVGVQRASSRSLRVHWRRPRIPGAGEPPRTSSAAATGPRCRPATDWSSCHAASTEESPSPQTGPRPHVAVARSLACSPIAPTDDEEARPSSVRSTRLARGFKLEPCPYRIGRRRPCPRPADMP
ncbi:hypothetical protein DPM33_20670 [Mesorhizobium hawassense]|uniref:Uncharacterized protein n=1 Tax=Mesorhizobium hawassense TaxID=1209954 RepID=A0A330HMU1_9HYPH|nr:hypothetical protein DPM33_20670 [Mesorhizobium hawassense]